MSESVCGVIVIDPAGPYRILSVEEYLERVGIELDRDGGVISVQETNLWGPNARNTIKLLGSEEECLAVSCVVEKNPQQELRAKKDRRNKRVRMARRAKKGKPIKKVTPLLWLGRRKAIG